MDNVSATIKAIDAGVLSIAYVEYGPASGWPCILGHGFPYDVHAYGDAAPMLAEAGARVIVPYLRGFGPTRFLKAETPRSGEQAALGADSLRAHRRAWDRAGNAWRLRLGRTGRLHCRGALAGAGRRARLGRFRQHQDIARAMEPAVRPRRRRLVSILLPQRARPARSDQGPARHRPPAVAHVVADTWDFDDATFARTAAAFDNPDFVEVVIHSYRHRYALAAGDPGYAEIEARLAAQPPIAVPAITMTAALTASIRARRIHADVAEPHQHRVFSRGGHNLPQERLPEDWARAVIDARAVANVRGSKSGAGR